MLTSYWNYENSEDIICPYCGEIYTPSYTDLVIGGNPVNCYTEDTREYVCDVCGKRFSMWGYHVSWKYHTETIPGQMTEEEWENFTRKQDG